MLVFAYGSPGHVIQHTPQAYNADDMTKKEKILRAALTLFAEQGVYKTSTTEITKKAGVASGTLFVHFKNKQALVDAIYLQVKKQEFSAFTSVLSENKTAKDNVFTLSKTIVTYYIQHTTELNFVLHVQQLKLVSKKAKAESSDFATEIYNYMNVWQQRGEIKKVNRSLLAEHSWTLLVTTAQYCKRNKKPVTDEMVEIIWDALKLR